MHNTFIFYILTTFLAIFPLQSREEAKTLHPFFVSISQIDYNAKYKSLEISMKVFSDDFAACVEKRGGGKLYLHTNKENAQANTQIAQYINENFSIQVNGKVAAMKFIGKEKEDDATWIYLEISNVNKVQSLNISNKLLFECYDSQTNMINVNVNGNKKSLVLKRNNAAGNLTF